MKKTGYDLKHSAELAIHHYCNFLDEKKNYIPYFYLLTQGETCGAHCEWDFGDVTGRYLDALILCTEIAGKTAESEEGIQRLYRALIQMLSEEDGLCYRPAGYEWVLAAANSFDQRSCILGLSSYYKYNPNPETYALMEKLIAGLYRMGVEYDDYFYIPVSDYNQDCDPSLFQRRPYDYRHYTADPCHYGGGVLIYPLMYWYHLTGSEAALELAGKLSRFIAYHSHVYAEDGSFYILGFGVDSDGHFHSRVDTAAGILEYALETNNSELASLSRRVYDWAVTQGTRYGLFPEGLGKRIETSSPEEYQDVCKHSETCGTADMIELALLLGKHFDLRYFDHAERYLNHLIASQLDDISWIAQPPAKEDTEVSTYRDALNRYRGAFTGRITVNDMTNFGRYDNMGCCCAAGGRGLAMLWNHAVEKQDRQVTIWMLINCENSLVRLQQENFGKFRICFSQPVDTVRVRIPGWMKSQAKSVQVLGVHDGKHHSLMREGDFLIFSADGETCFTLEAPVFEKEDSQWFCGENYQVFWKQNQVIEVLPHGKYHPIYLREQE